jgi:hypothetical protein
MKYDCDERSMVLYYNGFHYCLLFLRTGSRFFMKRLAVAAADGPVLIVVVKFVGFEGEEGAAFETTG